MPLAEPTARPLILVVDDEPILRVLLQTALPRSGFDVLLAADGTDAVDVYRRHRDRVAVVLMDVNMPGIDGPETLGELQKVNRDVCCCFMTGNAGAYADEELRRRGAATVFAKPFDLAELTQSLRRLAGRSRRAA